MGSGRARMVPLLFGQDSYRCRPITFLIVFGLYNRSLRRGQRDGVWTSHGLSGLAGVESRVVVDEWHFTRGLVTTFSVVSHGNGCSG